MKLLAAIIILVIIALLGSRLSFWSRKLPLGFRLILLTGTEYIFLGIILGNMGLNILDTKTLSQFLPVQLFVLCWIGFLFGLQFEVRQLKQLPQYYFSITAIQSLITFLVVSVFIYFLMKAFTSEDNKVLIISAMILGSTACCSAQSALFIVVKNHPVKNQNLVGLLRYISSVDGLFGLIFFGVALFLLPSINSEHFVIFESIKWILISFAIGLIPSIIFIVLSKSRFSREEYYLFLIGTIMFCAGMTKLVDYSPLISGFICGIVVANFCRHRIRALSLVIHGEKTVYIFLLIFVGASWHISLDSNVFFMIGYFVLRFFGKFLGAYCATSIHQPRYPVPFHLGLGLISEGGLALAMIMSCYSLNLVKTGDILLTTIIFSVLLSEIISPNLIINVLKYSKKS